MQLATIEYTMNNNSSIQVIDLFMTHAIHICSPAHSMSAIVFLPAMAGDDEGGLKLTYRTIPRVTNVPPPIDGNPANGYNRYNRYRNELNSEYHSDNQISDKHLLSQKRLAPERKASTGARDRSRAIPSPQCVSPPCLSYFSAGSFLLRGVGFCLLICKTPGHAVTLLQPERCQSIPTDETTSSS